MEEVGILSVADSASRGASLAEDGAGVACCGEEGAGAAMMVNVVDLDFLLCGLVWAMSFRVVSVPTSSPLPENGAIDWWACPEISPTKKSFLALYTKTLRSLYISTTTVQHIKHISYL
jgi:hypothetical protein